MYLVDNFGNNKHIDWTVDTKSEEWKRNEKRYIKDPTQFDWLEVGVELFV